MKAHGFFLLALAGAASTVLVQACGSDTEPAPDTSTTTVASSSSSSSSTGAGGSGGASPVATDCNTLCDYLGSIDCTAWKNCATECPAMFDAPDECADEFEEMLSCWVGHKTEFMCTDQLLTPAPCKPLEDAFYTCFKGTRTGGITCTDSVQVCGGDKVTHCTCKTTCSTTEYKSACTPQGANWNCSCYANEQLLGTCSIDPANSCNNFDGCCPPFFAGN